MTTLNIMRFVDEENEDIMDIQTAHGKIKRNYTTEGKGFNSEKSEDREMND